MTIHSSLVAKMQFFVLVPFEKMGGSLRIFDVIVPKYKIQIYIYGFSSGAVF